MKKLILFLALVAFVLASHAQPLQRTIFKATEYLQSDSLNSINGSTISVDANRLTDLANPVNDQDAVTLKAMRDSIQAAALGGTVGVTETQLADTAAQLRSEIPDISGLATETQLGDSIAQVRSEIATAGDGWGSDVVNHDVTLNGNGTSGSPLGVNSITAAQVSDFDTEVANNTAVAANTAKVSNATHTGEVVGSTALTVSDNVIDYGNVASSLKGAATDNDGAWDFSANGTIFATFSTNTTVTLSNLQTTKTVWIWLTISSSATVTWPSYVHPIGDAIDTDGNYFIVLACPKSDSGSEIVVASITLIQ